MCDKKRYISVALATFNGAKYIEKQVLSIISQSIKPDEIIVCDDCSTDHTLSILESMVRIYPTIKIYTNVLQLGVVGNFNKAISRCRGDYIAISDQDDIWLPKKLEKQLKAIIDHEKTSEDDTPLLCVHDLSVYSNTGQSEGSLWEILGDNPQIPKNNICFANKYYGCTFFFNKCLRNKILPIPESVPMHDHWIAVIAYYIGVIVVLNEPLIKYRRHTDNLTTISFDNSYLNRIKRYLGNIFGNDYMEMQISQASEIIKLNNDDLDEASRKEIQSIIKMKKDINFIRRIKFSIKHRLAR